MLVNLDKDFGDLIFGRGLAHGAVIHLVNFPVRGLAIAYLQLLERYAEELAAGAVITAKPRRVRIRAAE